MTKYSASKIAAGQAAPSFSAIDLDEVDAVQIARCLRVHYPVPHPQLVVDCSQLHCLRTLGVSHVVSQLLVLRQAGATIWLCNVGTVLRHCLTLLRLDKSFITLDAAATKRSLLGAGP